MDSETDVSASVSTLGLATSIIIPCHFKAAADLSYTYYVELVTGWFFVPLGSASGVLYFALVRKFRSRHSFPSSANDVHLDQVAF